VLGAGLAFAQQLPRRETDRDDRYLKGPVRSVKIVTEVLEAANKHESSDGWIPSEITFDKFGNIEVDLQFGIDGEVASRMTTEVDKTGNKIKEIYYTPSGEPKFTHVFEYDQKGNVVEFKRIEPDGKISTLSRSTLDKQGRNESNISFNTDGSINTISNVTYDKNGERTGGSTSTPEAGIVSRVDSKRTRENGVERIETIFFNADGSQGSRVVETTEKNGDHTHECFDEKGTLNEKQTWEYQKPDRHGNWTTEIMTKWTVGDGELILKLKKKTTRTISYF
jgi:hypothetical protein